MAALTADQLHHVVENTSKAFFAEENRKKFEDYIGLEELSNAFLKMNLPKASDVLDAAAGPGILSALLQMNGFATIDAMDHDSASLVAHLKSGLYRNCIGRGITSLNSTGLREDVYDAIVMAGGFCPDNISPTAINELLRITKPDGHIFWTLREDYHHKSTVYGLLDQNLRDLEKAGKCTVLRHEKFTDRHSGLDGMLYVVKRIDLEDFEPEEELPEEIPNILASTVKDDDNIDVGQYTGHVKVCQAFFKLHLRRDVEILDVSLHVDAPGLVGQELNHNGYVNVDGLDSKLEVLTSCRRRKIYRNYIVGRVAELGSIPVNDESYDVVLMAGGFAPDKILPSAFPELIRVLRPGGYILWCMKDGEGATCPEFALFDVMVQDLVLERKWEVLVGPVFFDNYHGNAAGRFYMLRKCHREVFALGSPRHSPHSSPRLGRRRSSLLI